MNPLAVYGAGGHGRVVADVARKCGYDKIVFIDDNISIDEAVCWEEFLANSKLSVALGIGHNHIRRHIFEKCKQEGVKIVSLVHPTALVSNDVTLGEGTVVMPRVVINSGTQIGCGCILNTGCIVEHDNTLGSFVHMAPGSISSGNVALGEGVHVGVGSCIAEQIKIGSYAYIGAGSVVVKDIPSSVVAYGNPCKPQRDVARHHK